MNMKKMHSCFVVDVSIGKTVTLTDSTRCRWYIDIQEGGVMDEFKKWLENVFTKGVAQTLTVFGYEDRSSGEGEVENYITRFYGLPAEPKMIAG